VELEAKAPDAQAKGTYNVIMGRILTRPALAKVAPYLLEARRRGLLAESPGPMTCSDSNSRLLRRSMLAEACQ